MIPPLKLKAPATVTLRLTETERREIERIAAMENRTMTNVIKWFIAEGLERVKK